MSILGAVIVPHPPLIIPTVGNGREEEVQTTIDAYRQDFTSAPPVCTNCGAELRDGAKFCAYCGTQVAAPALANVCPSCGETVEDTDLFCIACGTKVGENAAE